MQVAEVCGRRTAAQFLLRPSTDAVEIVRALGAVQAQDYSGAKWALGQRVAGATDAAIESLFAGGAILRTHVLRPTWHFVAPADIRWMLALTAPRVVATMASYNRKLELTPDVFRRSHDIIARALEGKRHLMRAELRNILAREGILASTQRLGHLMMQAELDAVICSGPRRGKQFTYALLDERAPPATPRDRDASLEDLTLRYFATRGPATVADMSWWSGLAPADVKRGIEIAGKRLRRSMSAAGHTGSRRSKPRRDSGQLRTCCRTTMNTSSDFAIGARWRPGSARCISSAAVTRSSRISPLSTDSWSADGVDFRSHRVWSWRSSW